MAVPAVMVVPATEPIPKDPFVSDLRLLVVPAAGGKGEPEPEAKFVTVGPFCDVQKLKWHVAEAFRVQVMDMTLFFQNPEGPHSQRLQLLDLGYSLKHQGVRSGATIVCQLAAWDLPTSKLGDSAYYAWSANQKAVPDEIRIQRCGPPMQLARPAEGEKPSGGAGREEEEERKAPRRNIQNYSWVDESRRAVKVYISAEGEPAALAAAGAEGDGLVRADFQEGGFQVDIVGEAVTYSLRIEALEHKIAPEGCKVKVSAGKRITVTLKKAKEDSLWNTLVRRR